MVGDRIDKIDDSTLTDVVVCVCVCACVFLRLFMCIFVYVCTCEHGLVLCNDQILI